MTVDAPAGPLSLIRMMKIVAIVGGVVVYYWGKWRLGYSATPLYDATKRG